MKNKEKVLKDVCKLMETHVKRFPQYFSTNQTIKDVSVSFVLIELFENFNFQDARELLVDLTHRNKDTNKEEQKQSQDETSAFGVVDGFKMASDKLLDVVDNGMCLSMHQPYASLLVAGIKKQVVL